ncbi:fibrobacter succinogenes major paralogous domain-containing protein [Flavobacteriales bacterium]|nr:fibrobacter succinogenes major paralogous domain-containing protein [Flavobacteriales bacterium]
MRAIYIILFSLIATSISAQTIMSIHRPGQPVLQIPIADVDSITYSAVGDPGAFAIVTTQPMSSFTVTTATLGGTVDLNNGTPVTSRGIAWSVLPSPTTADSVVYQGVGSGSFLAEATDLEVAVIYYARAFAINSAGISYGNEVEFSTTIDLFIPGPGVTDDDGNFYPTLQMGNGQEWMAENLRTTVYANGDPIPNIQDATDWGSQLTGAWCHYNNNVANEIPFGKLYNWYTVTDSRNACPTGWHAPTDAEFTSLTTFLGGLSFSGGKLKGVGTAYWLSPNEGATNISGMTFLPGGTRTGAGVFQEMFGTGVWWTSTSESSFTGFRRTLYYTSQGVFVGGSSNIEGASVRCVKD